MNCNWKTPPRTLNVPAAIRFACLLLLAAAAAPGRPSIARAQEGPYFIAYDHHMEEPGHLEISVSPALGIPRGANNFLSELTEFEYGLKGWWTTEFYLDGQTTAADSTLFTGYRFENRVRPLMREHWINPVLYLEFEDINGADKAIKEVVGFDSSQDLATSNAEARREKLREIEAKLILSSDYKGWNFAENFIAEKNLSNGPWEFGYALGLNRPLALAASPNECALCRENFRLGLELYGGLGTWRQFTLSRTSHYLGPLIALELPNGVTLRVGPAFGLTPSSSRALIRFGVAYEISDFGRLLRNLFH